MRSRTCTVALLAALALASLATRHANAQADAARAGPSAADRPRAGEECAAGGTYDECALRFEEGRIRRGLAGETVLRLGWFTNVAGRVPWLSDSAHFHARRYQSIHSTATLVKAVAVGGTIASLVLGANAKIDDSGDVARYDKSKIRNATILSLGSTALGYAGGIVNRHAKRHLSRAVWWHNRALVQR
jgi:hypothetical protein